jgi:hypothetical protein
MPKLQVKIVNAETGEEIIRDMNADELAQMEIDKADTKANADALAAKEAAKAELLAKLGISADEAKLLLS